MSIYVIPVVSGEGNYDFGITIEQIGYSIALQWNSRDNTVDDNGNVLVAGAWYFSVFDVNGAPINTGIKVTLGAFLGKTCQDPLFQNGVFIAMDMSGLQQDAGFNDFGTRVLLLYVPNVDLAKVLSV